MYPNGGDVDMLDESIVDSTEGLLFDSQASVFPRGQPQNDLQPHGQIPNSQSSQDEPKATKGEDRTFDFQLTDRKDAPQPAKYAALPYASSQTGLVYDVRMRFHVEPEQTEEDIHPEDPRRIHAIYESFQDAGLTWREDPGQRATGFYMGRIGARFVKKEEVCLVHTESHWNWVQGLRHVPTDQLDDLGRSLDSVYVSNQTPFCAGLSAGGGIEACRSVMLGKVKNAFAIIRPPGHHAEREDAKGFCFFDNVSIATKVCQGEFGERCRKVMILDWDVHHGNGIQQANYSDPNVLYVSLHVHEHGRFYPEGSYRDRRGPYGDHLHCGEGAGLGKNVNVPWSRKGMGDADYIYAFQQVIMPIALEFEPDLVIVAAGFDAAEGDMLGGCKVSPAGYAHMTHMLMSLANGKVAVLLEGGYNLDSIARSATAVARTLMGEPPDRLINTQPTITGVDDVKLVLRQQSKFWSSLHPKDISARLAGPLHGVRMHDVVRRWQAETLWDDYEMIPLSVYNTPLVGSFKHQVLATPNHAGARPLVVILHDPPEVLASPDPRTGRIELHNTWLTDIVKTYVDWACKQGFGVVDVNLPKHHSDASDSQEHEPNDAYDVRIREATQLLKYLWDNYIDLNEATHVFLIGTNTGHGAIINFIKNNEDRAQERITGAISFIEDVPVMSCRSSATNDLLWQWYYGVSQVFVAHDHNLWHSDQKIKKRFGKVVRCEKDSITDMLLEHKDTVTQFILEETADWVEEKEEEAEPASPAKSKLPPVGNFALSPRALTSAAAGGSRNGVAGMATPPPARVVSVSPGRRPP